MSRVTGSTLVAGVIGAPVRHSLSPIIHNAWLAAAGVDGVYVPFPLGEGRLAALVEGLRGGAVRGLNVTLPFKEEALVLSDTASEAALQAGAANLLLFSADGSVTADNTDGVGLIAAFNGQLASYFDSHAHPVVILGAGGAARGAASALLKETVGPIRLVNRTRERAEAIRTLLSDPDRIEVFGWEALPQALAGAGSVINATSLGLNGKAPLTVSFDGLAPGAVVMDMVYRPLRTAFLERAEAAGFACVDGLDMLIGQARPSFEAFFGRPPPPRVDVRALALTALEAGR